MNDTVAIVLAAGLGTRMKSDTPKGLHAVAGKPLVHWPVQAALDAGCRRVAIVVGHGAEQVESSLRARFPGADLVFPRQEQQLGTAHATLCARDAADGFAHALLINGDLPLLTGATFQALREAFAVSGGAFALVTSVVDDPGGFGRIVRDADGAVQRIVERRDATPAQEDIHEVNVGVYLARTDLLFPMLASVGDHNAVKEFYFTDIVTMMRARGLGVGAYVLPGPDQAMQVNDRIELAAAEAAMHLRHARDLMASGVTIHRPASVLIDPDCTVGRDTEVWPGVEMHAGTRVGARCVVGRGAVLSGVAIGDGVDIKPYCVLTDSTVEDDGKLGPFSHLRPASIMRRGSHVGNFVELKKTELGEGSKANHLTYLGDCTVGRKANIGAGTITCNYDGVNKFPTVIEDGAFIGSDTQLVAPVRVGKEAYVGAGATITRDVPDGALAITRVPQVHVEGYVQRKRAQRESKG
jgi:bifunctional UDP-N-acetylglucosamine pyrophosphorylase/glucosamine-1-phosphate N-acetyltransferase